MHPWHVLKNWARSIFHFSIRQLRRGNTTKSQVVPAPQPPDQAALAMHQIASIPQAVRHRAVDNAMAKFHLTPAMPIHAKHLRVYLQRGDYERGNNCFLKGVDP